MKNKTIAYGLSYPVVGAVLVGILSDAISVELSDSLYAILGLTLFVFCIVAAIRLYKTPDKE